MKRSVISVILILAMLLSLSSTTLSYAFAESSGVDLSSQPTETFSDENEDDAFILLGEGFTDRKITDQLSALLAIDDVADVLGVTDTLKEFGNCRVDNVFGNTYYRFYQEYKGIPVYGRSIVVGADEEGSSLFLTGNYLPVENVNVVPELTQDIVNSAVYNYFQLSDRQNLFIENLSNNNLIIYNMLGECTLAFQLYVESPQIGYYKLIVDAGNADLICAFSVIHNDTYDAGAVGSYITERYEFGDSGKMTVIDVEGQRGNRYELPVYEENGNYFLADTSRNIEVNMMKGGFYWFHSKDSGQGERIQFAKNDINSVDKSAIDALRNIQKTYDFYEQVLNHKGTDGNGKRIDIITNIAIPSYENSIFGDDWSNNAFSFVPEDGSSTLITVGRKSNGETYTRSANIEVMAHEYTHGVINHICGLAYEPDSPEAIDHQSGAIHEGLADIFGELVEAWDTDGFADWIHGSRILSNPALNGYPKTVSDIEDAKNYEEHWCSTVISHTAFLMRVGVFGKCEPIENETLAKLFYRTIFSLPQNCTFSQYRTLVENAARIMYDHGEGTGKLTREQLKTISEAFDSTQIWKADIPVSKRNFTVVISGTEGTYNDFTLYLKRDDGWEQKYSSEEVNKGIDFPTDGEYEVVLVDNKNQNNQYSKWVQVYEKGGTTELSVLDYDFTQNTEEPLVDNWSFAPGIKTYGAAENYPMAENITVRDGSSFDKTTEKTTGSDGVSAIDIKPMEPENPDNGFTNTQESKTKGENSTGVEYDVFDLIEDYDIPFDKEDDESDNNVPLTKNEEETQIDQDITEIVSYREALEKYFGKENIPEDAYAVLVDVDDDGIDEWFIAFEGENSYGVHGPFAVIISPVWGVGYNIGPQAQHEAYEVSVLEYEGKKYIGFRLSNFGYRNGEGYFLYDPKTGGIENARHFNALKIKEIGAFFVSNKDTTTEISGQQKLADLLDEIESDDSYLPEALKEKLLKKTFEDVTNSEDTCEIDEPQREKEPSDESELQTENAADLTEKPTDSNNEIKEFESTQVSGDTHKEETASSEVSLKTMPATGKDSDLTDESTKEPDITFEDPVEETDEIEIINREDPHLPSDDVKESIRIDTIYDNPISEEYPLITIVPPAPSTPEETMAPILVVEDPTAPTEPSDTENPVSNDIVQIMEENPVTDSELDNQLVSGSELDPGSEKERMNTLPEEEKSGNAGSDPGRAYNSVSNVAGDLTYSFEVGVAVDLQDLEGIESSLSDIPDESGYSEQNGKRVFTKTYYTYDQADNAMTITYTYDESGNKLLSAQFDKGWLDDNANKGDIISKEKELVETDKNEETDTVDQDEQPVSSEENQIDSNLPGEGTDHVDSYELVDELIVDLEDGIQDTLRIELSENGQYRISASRKLIGGVETSMPEEYQSGSINELIQVEDKESVSIGFDGNFYVIRIKDSMGQINSCKVYDSNSFINFVSYICEVEDGVTKYYEVDMDGGRTEITKEEFDVHIAEYAYADGMFISSTETVDQKLLKETAQLEEVVARDPTNSGRGSAIINAGNSGVFNGSDTSQGQLNDYANALMWNLGGEASSSEESYTISYAEKPSEHTTYLGNGISGFMKYKPTEDGGVPVEVRDGEIYMGTETLKKEDLINDGFEMGDFGMILTPDREPDKTGVADSSFAEAFASSSIGNEYDLHTETYYSYDENGNRIEDTYTIATDSEGRRSVQAIDREVYEAVKTPTTSAANPYMAMQNARESFSEGVNAAYSAAVNAYASAVAEAYSSAISAAFSSIFG